MKYLLTIYGDESGWNEVTPEQSGQIMAAYEAFGRAASEAGVMLGGEGLQPSATATTVRVRDGETGRSRRRASSSAATTCSSAATSTTRSRGRRASPARSRARSRSGR